MKKLILAVLFGSLSVVVISAQIPSIEEIKSTIEQAETFEEKSKVCIQFSKELFANDLELSIEIAADAVIYANKSGDSELLIKAYNNVGNLSRLEGNLQLANQYYRTALEIANQTGNNRYKGRILFNIATCKLQLEDYPGAEADLLESEKMMLSVAHSQGNSHLGIAEFLALQNNKALIEVGKGNNVEATQLYQVILDSISGKNEYLANELQALYGIADALLKAGQYEESTKNYQMGLDLAQTKENDLFKVTFNYGLGKAYGELGQVERALDYGNIAFRLAQELNSSSILSHVTKLIGELYERQAQPDSALYYRKLSDDYEAAMQLPDARVELTADGLNRKFREREAILNQEWNQTKRSYLGWILGLVGFSILGFYFYIQNRRRLNQTEIDRMKLKLANEKEMLEKEVLQQELNLKDKELVKQTLESIQKNEMISQAIEQIENGGKLRRNVLSQITNSSAVDDSLWNEFEVRFQNVHQSFYDNLLEAHPKLTSNERRLCAFLKLDMSTKEISAITGQSIRAIELGRIRLRKKMNITGSSTSLFEYLSKF